MTLAPNILRVLPCLLVAACAAPKATVVEEPRKKADVAKQDEAPAPPASNEADQLRMPTDILGKLPDRNEFQATNPKAASGKSEGAPVIAHPPSDPPAADR